jgi:FAD/FMN-containing dehydrogenase
MSSPVQIATSLQASLSNDAQILTDPDSSSFKESLKRWSDVGIQVPAAIIKAGCEDDVVKIVNTAIMNQIPLVARGGGNSPWSTIGSQGWILDLSLLTAIILFPSTQTVTLGPGVLSKSINEAVSKIGFCIQSPGSSKVACIPFILGGGSSYLNGLYGMAVDSLVSASVVTAKKGLVTASEEENPELFWALKGAGHFFGAVTSVTMRMYPLKEDVISWNCIFPVERITEVAGALEVVSKGEQVIRSPGLAAIMAPPGSSKVCSNFEWL